MADQKLEKIEMLRGFASTYVFAGHVLAGSVGVFNLFLHFGQEMVMCFFLLSGFVIYYSTHHARHKSFRVYFIHRFRRIYPTLLVALLISYALMILDGKPQVDWGRLAGNIFMLQDLQFAKPGVWVDTFGGNIPLWSLSYEWWFYMMFFPIYAYVPVRWQLGLVAALSFAGLGTYVAHPNQISLFLLYFILWWTGLEFARTYCRGITPTFFTQRHSLAVLGGFCLLVPAAMIFLMPAPAHWIYGNHPLQEIRNFEVCFFFSVVALLWSRAGWRFFRPLLSWFALAAPVSYALYAFHYPLCVVSRGLGWGLSSPLPQAGLVLLTITLAYLVEVRLQKAIVRWTNRLILSKINSPQGGTTSSLSTP
jgi:peptidoglycan/LPS O-acetylase OafA/YrhL